MSQTPTLSAKVQALADQAKGGMQTHLRNAADALQRAGITASILRQHVKSADMLLATLTDESSVKLSPIAINMVWDKFGPRPFEPPIFSHEDADPVEVKVGNVVRLDASSSASSPRDLKYTPKKKLVVTNGVEQLVNKFWKDDCQELCIRGASGIGKSCGLKILAADIARRKPNALIIYIRTWLPSFLQRVSDIVTLSSSRSQSTFVLVDQVEEGVDARRIGKLAQLTNVRVVLVSSSNILHFHTDSQGAQHVKHVHEFCFSCTIHECKTLCKSLNENLQCRLPRGRQPEPASPIKFNLSASKCKWQPGKLLRDSYVLTNGNMLLLAQLFFRPTGTIKDGVEREIQRKAKLMTEFFGKDTICAKFYHAIVKMFDCKETSISVEDTRQNAKWFDLRYVSHSGHVLAPIYLEAFDRAIRLNAAPPHVWATTFRSILLENSSVKGFIVERDCLVQDKLLLVARAVLRHYGQTTYPRAVLTNTQHGTTMSFCDTEDLTDKIVSNATQQSSWYFHGIPVDWNFRHVDAVQVYFFRRRNKPHQLIIIGNQVTLKNPSDHWESVKWLAGDARRLATSLVADLNMDSDIDVLKSLVYTSKAPRKPTVTVNVNSNLEENETVFHFPLDQAVSDGCRQALDMDAQSASKSKVQKLTVTRKRSVKAAKPSSKKKPRVKGVNAVKPGSQKKP